MYNCKLLTWIKLDVNRQSRNRVRKHMNKRMNKRWWRIKHQRLKCRVLMFFMPWRDCIVKQPKTSAEVLGVSRFERQTRIRRRNYPLRYIHIFLLKPGNLKRAFQVQGVLELSSTLNVMRDWKTFLEEMMHLIILRNPSLFHHLLSSFFLQGKQVLLLASWQDLRKKYQRMIGVTRKKESRCIKY